MRATRSAIYYSVALPSKRAGVVEATVSVHESGVDIASIHYALKQWLHETIQVGTLLHDPRGRAEPLMNVVVRSRTDVA